MRLALHADFFVCRAIPGEKVYLRPFDTNCFNNDFTAWDVAYDDAKSKKSLAVVALGVGAGIWLLNLIDSATGFPRERSVADSRLRVQAPHPHVIVRQGTPHYGFRFMLTF